jgi:hypothetical protein
MVCLVLVPCSALILCLYLVPAATNYSHRVCVCVCEKERGREREGERESSQGTGIMSPTISLRLSISLRETFPSLGSSSGEQALLFPCLHTLRAWQECGFSVEFPLAVVLSSLQIFWDIPLWL